MIYFLSNLIGVLLGLGDNWSHDLISILRTHFEEVISSILQLLPSFLGLWLQLSILSLLNLVIDVIPHFLHPSLQQPSKSSKR